jgi:hypothetical protein
MDGLQIQRSKKKLEILLVLIIGEPGEFVSGIYAEILHVEKCFLMYISLAFLYFANSTTVADRFFFYRMQQFNPLRRCKKGREKCCKQGN